MATYNSTQAGNWTDSSTWGGSGYPSANDDVVNIGHEINYNAGESNVAYGNITINNGGVLDFPTNQNSKLVFNNTGLLTINSGGKLSCGSEASPIDKAYTLKIYWPQGSSTRDVMLLNDGGEIALYGDPDFYGSERYAELDSDWTSGQTLYVQGDFSSKWQAGQHFSIYRNIKYNNYSNDTYIFEIDSVGAYDSANDRTPITIVEANPGESFTALYYDFRSKLILIDRNIELADYNSSFTFRDFSLYTERIVFDSNQGGNSYLINYSNVLFRGWYRVAEQGFNLNYSSCSFINNYNIYNTNSAILNDCSFVSNNQGLYACYSIKIINPISMGNYYLISSGNNIVITNLIDINSARSFTCSRSSITGTFVGNYWITEGGSMFDVDGEFIGNGYCFTGARYVNIKGVFKNNNYCFNDTCRKTLCKSVGFIDNTHLISINNIRYKNSVVLEDCMFESTDRRAIRIYENTGNFLPLVSGDTDWETPPSNNDWILQTTPNSYCKDGWVNQMELSPLNKMAQYVTAGSKTLTYKIYPVGWTAALTNDDVVLEVEYLDSASGVTRTTAVNSTATYNNNAWRDVSVALNPPQDGIIYFQLYIKKYETGCYILIDPEIGLA